MKQQTIPPLTLNHSIPSTEGSTFTQDTLAFFKKVRGSHLGKHLYGGNGTELYGNITKSVQDYYIHRDEISLIQDAAPSIQSRLPPHPTIIEYGTGNQQAVEHKTLPLLESIPHLEGYYPVDISKQYIETASKIVKSRLPQITIRGFNIDFFKEVIKIPCPQHPVIFFKGSTIANFDPVQATDILRMALNVFGKKLKIIVGYDRNHDPETLIKAYHHKLGEQFILNVFNRIGEELDLPISSKDFEYKVVWDAESEQIQHIAESLSTKTFLIKGVPVTLKAGEQFHILSSYKYSAQSFKNMAHSAGLKSTASFTGTQNRVALDILAVA